jgi:hypothetical protein
MPDAGKPTTFADLCAHDRLRYCGLWRTVLNYCTGSESGTLEAASGLAKRLLGIARTKCNSEVVKFADDLFSEGHVAWARTDELEASFVADLLLVLRPRWAGIAADRAMVHTIESALVVQK